MEIIKHRQKKRYGWLVFLAALNWVAIGLVVWKVDPEMIKDFILPGSYLPMTFLTMGGIFWLLAILFLSASRALRWTMGITAFLEMRVLGLGSVINGVLILGLLISLEIYLIKTKTQGIKESRTQDKEME
jgi:hypothetical protein